MLLNTAWAPSEEETVILNWKRGKYLSLIASPNSTYSSPIPLLDCFPDFMTGPF
jgi:hypothetical protein